MSRHRSRYRAVQILYQVDMRGLSPEEAIRAYYDSLYSEENETPQHDAFMESLVHGTVSRRSTLDEQIEHHSEHWKLDRMPVVERNLLRLAVYEMLEGGTPAPVVIDEALEVARRLAGDESVSFVNGVLDAVRKDLGKQPAAQ